MDSESQSPSQRQQRARWSLGLLALCVGAAAFLAAGRGLEARAQAGGPATVPAVTRTAVPNATAIPDALEPAAATATPTPTATAAPGCDFTHPGQCVQNFIQSIQFDFTTLFDAVVTLVSRMLQGAYEGVRGPFAEALRVVLFSPFGIAPAGTYGALGTPLFAGLIWTHWLWTLTLAAALLPVTLMLTAVDALKQGAASVLSTVQLKEALLHWGLSAGTAAASYYILGLAYRLSTSAAAWILSSGPAVDLPDLISGAVFPSRVVTLLVAGIATPPLAPLTLMLTGFMLFLAISLIVAVLFALAAVIALVYLVSVLAPLILVLGQLPPLRWLHDLWLKAVVLVFLLPPVNALLLRAAAFLSLGIAGGDGWAAALVSLVVMAGVLSALITLDYKVGEAVFGGLQQVMQNYAHTVQDLARLTLSAVAVVASGSPLGLAGAVGTSTAPTTAAGGDAALTANGSLTPATGATVSGSAEAHAGAGPASAPAPGGGAGVRERVNGRAAPSGNAPVEPGANKAAFTELAQRKVSGAPAIAEGAAPAPTPTGAAERQAELERQLQQQRVGEGLRTAGGLLAGSRNDGLRLTGQGLSAAGGLVQGQAAARLRRAAYVERESDREQQAQFRAEHAARAQKNQEERERDRQARRHSPQSGEDTEDA